MWKGGVRSFFGADICEAVLHEYVDRNIAHHLPQGLESILIRYAPIALVMDRFFHKLQTDSKLTNFPIGELAKLSNILKSSCSKS